MMSILRRRSDAQNSPGATHAAYSVTRSNPMFSALDDIRERSQALSEKKKIPGFLDKAKDAQEVVNLVEELRSTIVYYQVSGTLYSAN